MSEMMRAVIIVAYVHADAGDEEITKWRDEVLGDMLDTDLAEDYVQVAVSNIVGIAADEAIEWYVDDNDDLEDEDEASRLDDLRADFRHGSTPRCPLLWS